MSVHYVDLVLDCGGGTVDITVHEVMGLSPLALREVTHAHGDKVCSGLLGSTSACAAIEGEVGVPYPVPKG